MDSARGVCAIRGRDGDQTYVNSTIEAELPRLLSKATGSVFPSLSAPDLKNFRVLRPSAQVMSQFLLMRRFVSGEGKLAFERSRNIGLGP